MESLLAAQQGTALLRDRKTAEAADIEREKTAGHELADL